jgi:hypothetical protein
LLNFLKNGHDSFIDGTKFRNVPSLDCLASFSGNKAFPAAPHSAANLRDRGVDRCELLGNVAHNSIKCGGVLSQSINWDCLGRLMLDCRGLREPRLTYSTITMNKNVPARLDK